MASLPVEDERPQVTVLSTGGSISMGLNQSGRRVPDLDAEAMIERIPDLPDATYRARSVYAIGSHAATFEHWVSLAHEIRDVLAEGSRCVVTHGTDTLAEAAFFVAETLGNPDVVFVGAMRPPGSPGEDGIRNLRDGIVAATSGTRLGTTICMNGQVLTSWSATKADSIALDAFAARAGGRIARVHDGRLWLESGPLMSNWVGALPDEIERREIPPLVTLAHDMEPEWLARVLHGDFRAVVIVTIGGGSVPPTVRPVLIRAAREIEVVATTGPWHGPVVSNELYPHSLDELEDAGVVIENVLDGPRARVRAAVSLATGRNYSAFSLGLSSP